MWLSTITRIRTHTHTNTHIQLHRCILCVCCFELLFFRLGRSYIPRSVFYRYDMRIYLGQRWNINIELLSNNFIYPFGNEKLERIQYCERCVCVCVCVCRNVDSHQHILEWAPERSGIIHLKVEFWWKSMENDGCRGIWLWPTMYEREREIMR